MQEKDSESFWPQMLLKNIKGPFENEIPNALPIIETTWGIAKTHFPEAVIFSNENNIGSKNSTPSKLVEDINNNERVFGLINNIYSKSSNVFIFQSIHQQYSNFRKRNK